jgi:hypothetical protein
VELAGEGMLGKASRVFKGELPAARQNHAGHFEVSDLAIGTFWVSIFVNYIRLMYGWRKRRMLVCLAEWADSCRILTSQASMGRSLIVAVYKQFKYRSRSESW